MSVTGTWRTTDFVTNWNIQVRPWGSARRMRCLCIK